MYLRERGCEDVKWIHLAQDNFQWQDLVYTAIKVLVPWRRTVWLAKALAASQEGLCSMEIFRSI
jgi:hypothetical protein